MINLTGKPSKEATREYDTTNAHVNKRELSGLLSYSWILLGLTLDGYFVRFKTAVGSVLS